MERLLMEILLKRVLPAFAGALGAVLVAQYPELHSSLCLVR